MYEFSVEQAANKINDTRVKAYFGEVMNSYFNGNYRSATVMLWTVIICDLIYKLQFLRDIHNDSQATNILKEISDLQNKNPTSPAWELTLIQLIKEKTKLFELHEYDAIESIQKHRHLSAHPILSSIDMLFRPTREMVLSDIRIALDMVLTKPPILTKKVFNELVEDIEKIKDLLVEEIQLKKYLNSKYFGNLNDETRAELFKSLWRITFKSEDAKCNENREINHRTLRLLFETNRDYLSKYIHDNSHYFSELSENLLAYVIYFVGDYPYLYENLSGAAKELIKAKANSDIDLLAVSYFLSKDIKSHILNLSDFITKNYLNNFGCTYKICSSHIKDIRRHATSEGIEEDLYDLQVNMYINSVNFNAADWQFSNFIEPFLNKFSAANILNLIDGIEKNNQTYWRGRSNIDHKMIVSRAKEVIPDFDKSLYTYLPD